MSFWWTKRFTFIASTIKEKVKIMLKAKQNNKKTNF